MYKRVFIDANIFIDSNDERRLSYSESYKIIPYLLRNNIEVYTSCDLITTIYYILSKVSKENALHSIEQINKICKVIEFSNKEVSQTCNLMRENENFKDLEDTLQYVLAQKSACELIISNDKNFYADDMQLMTSKEFCKEYIK
ncbi:MAG: type II toxin-antitoxin system VapC family toxin [Sulfurimonas sp.]|nr:type II toxin-antitoxin system VapC family toxin [Sulfurimonas sp.]